MRTLIRFLLQYGVYFLFVLLETISFLLIVNHNQFQKSVFLSSSNKVIGSIYAYQQSVYDYFSLARTNGDLAEENVALKNQIVLLQNQLVSLSTDSTKGNLHIAPEKDVKFLSAKVVNNSTSKLQNYITLNAGSVSGVSPEMGVINEDGVVGIVQTVSDNFSVVIPILNPKSKISCKLKRSNYFGTLAWNGVDYRFAELIDVPRHVQLAVGDSVLTSGYSSVFPEGIMVGKVESFSKKESDNYYKIKVRLAVNFRTLSYVKVIHYLHQSEQKKLEERASK